MRYEDIAKEIGPVKRINCPLCKNDTGWDVHINDYALPDHKIWCDKCGLIYRCEIPTEDKNDNFYNNFYIGNYMKYRTQEEFYKSTQQKLRRQSINYLEKLIKASITPIEIGCGAGGVLQLASQINSKIIGVDISEEAIKFAQSKGLNAINKNINLLPNKEYDFVLMSHVFEHLLDPLWFLGQIERITKDSGLFAVIVPDVEYKPEAPHFPHTFNFMHRPLLQLIENYSNFRFFSDNTKNKNGDLIIVFKKAITEEKKYDDYFTCKKDFDKHMKKMKPIILEKHRSWYDNAKSKNDRKNAVAAYKKDSYFLRPIQSWMLWSRLYVLFSGKFMKNK